MSANVILRPVDLLPLDTLILQARERRNLRDRTGFAQQLVFGKLCQVINVKHSTVQIACTYFTQRISLLPITISSMPTSRFLSSGRSSSQRSLAVSKPRSNRVSTTSLHASFVAEGVRHGFLHTFQRWTQSCGAYTAASQRDGNERVAASRLRSECEAHMMTSRNLALRTPSSFSYEMLLKDDQSISHVKVTRRKHGLSLPKTSM